MLRPSLLALEVEACSPLLSFGVFLYQCLGWLVWFLQARCHFTGDGPVLHEFLCFLFPLFFFFTTDERPHIPIHSEMTGNARRRNVIGGLLFYTHRMVSARARASCPMPGLPGDRAGYTGQRVRGSGEMCANDGIDTLSFPISFFYRGRLRVALLFEYMLITEGTLVLMECERWIDTTFRSKCKHGQ